MDRRVILEKDYPRGQFISAFFSVIWLRGAFFIPPDHPLIPIAKLAFASPPPPCRRAPDGSACHACESPMRRRVAFADNVMPDCVHVVSQMVAFLFFGSAWGGELPQCAVRCHRIVVSKSPVEQMEHCCISEEHMARWCVDSKALTSRPMTPGDADWLHVIENGEVLPYKKTVISQCRNSAALTIATALLCVKLEPSAPHVLYIKLRDALRSGNPQSAEIDVFYQTICGFVLARNYNTASRSPVPVWADQFSAWLQKYHAFMSIDTRISSIMSFRGKFPMECVLGRDHEMHRIECPSGVYVELRWSRSAMSMIEARTTVHVWVRYLGLVSADDVLVKCVGDTHTVIVLREHDLVRLMRYAPSHLHCSRVIELRMPVYKMLCQNYMQINADGDVGGARLFVRDFLSLVASQVVTQSSVGEKFTSTLGCFHGILGRFVDTLSHHARKPFLDEHVVKVLPETPSNAQRPDLAAPYRGFLVTPPAKMTVVDGFYNGSGTLQSAIVAFFCLSEPHIITVEAVKLLYRLFCQNPRFQSRSSRCMHVVDALYQKLQSPHNHIQTTAYIEIPSEMYGLVEENVPPVAYLYALLVTDIIPPNFAVQLFLSIRLCPRMNRVFPRPSSFKPADTRTCGVEGLMKLHRVYQTALPTGEYSRLYTAVKAPDIGYMHYLTFFMEMQTYVQWVTLGGGDLQKCKQEFGSYGVDPHSALKPGMYRGMLSPAHIVRYARRDGRDIHTNVHAYEIDANEFQHQVVPVVRFRDSARIKDISRVCADTGSPSEQSPLVGCDPFLWACLFTMPIDYITVESLRTFQKRKLAELSDVLKSDLNPVLKRVRTDSSVPWGFPKELFPCT